MYKNGGYSGGERKAAEPSKLPSGSGNSKIVTERYCRDACTGKYVSKAYADKHSKTTIQEVARKRYKK